MRADEARRLLAERTPKITAAVVPTKGAAASALHLAAGAPRREEAAEAGGRAAR